MHRYIGVTDNSMKECENYVLIVKEAVSEKGVLHTGIKRRGGHVCVGTYVTVYVHVFVGTWMQ